MENLAWQYLPVGHDYDRVRRERCDLLDRLWIFNPLGLQDGGRRRWCPANKSFFDGRRLDCLSAARRLVSLRHNSDDLVARVEQSLQRRHTDCPGADENNAHSRLWLQLMPWNTAARPSPRHRLFEHFLSSGDLAPAYRRSTPGAEIIEYFSIRQDKQQPFA